MDKRLAGGPLPLIDWFEIPVCDLERAVAFYEAVFEMELHIQELLPGYRMAFLPLSAHARPGPGGALVEASGYTPAGYRGCRIYFAQRDLDACLIRVEEAGGQIRMPGQQIGTGSATAWLAYVLDTEGNLLGLHAPGAGSVHLEQPETPAGS